MQRFYAHARRAAGAGHRRQRRSPVRWPRQRDRRHHRRSLARLTQEASAMPDAVIVAAVRTPVGKAPNGTLRHTRPDDLAAAAITAALARVPALDPGRGRGRHPRLRHARGRAGPERRAHRQPAGRRPAHARPPSPSIASAPPACNRSPTPPSGSRAAPPTSSIAGGTESMSLVPMGGLQGLAQPDAGRHLSRRLSLERPGRREPRPRVEDQPRGAGRLRAREPSQGRRRHRRRTLRRRDRRRSTPRSSTPRPPVGRAPAAPQAHGHRRRARAATRRSRHWPSSSRRSTRPAASPPATRRRPATAPPR